MSILLSLVLALNAAPAPVQQIPAVTDLSYNETFACSALAEAGIGMMTQDGTTPVTTGEIKLVDDLTRLKSLADAAMEPARLRDGWDPAQAETQRDVALQALGQASDDDLIGALGMCGAIFGVTFE